MRTILVLIIVAALAATVANAEDYIFNMKFPLGCAPTVFNFKFDQCPVVCKATILAGCTTGKCNESGNDAGKCTCTCTSDPNKVPLIDIPQNIINLNGGK